jgi:hypothetical protein
VDAGLSIPTTSGVGRCDGFRGAARARCSRILGGARDANAFAAPGTAGPGLA